MRYEIDRNPSLSAMHIEESGELPAPEDDDGLIGPFNCNNRAAGISVSFYLRHVGYDCTDGFFLKQRQRDIAYARGVVDQAMVAIWGLRITMVEFLANGSRWRIEHIRVKAKKADA